MGASTYSHFIYQKWRYVIYQKNGAAINLIPLQNFQNQLRRRTLSRGGHNIK